MKTITARIKDGKIQITTEGFVGTSCQDATRAIEAALAGAVVSDEPTREMYEDDLEAQRGLER